MPQRPWRFLINPFEVATQSSYKKALSIGEDHKAKLLNFPLDPEIVAILATFDPVLQSYKTTDQNLQSAEGTYEGKTQTVEELFEELNGSRLPYWEGQIHFVYPEGTPGETNLFPDDRKPFQKGTYEQRISAIKVLGDKCALDANATIAAVSVNILAFHAAIEGARVLQQSQGEAAVATLRNLREDARVLLCQELYGNLGTLMHKHRANPLVIDQYFDLSYLRTPASGADVYEIEENGVVNIMANVVAGDVTGTKIKNTSDENVTIYIYFAASISDQPQSNPIALHQGEEKILNEADMGTLQPFVNVFNSSQHKGSFTVTGN